MFTQIDSLETAEPLEPINRTADLFFRVLLAGIAVAIVAGSVILMLKMNETWRNQGGRYLVAAGAFVLLIAVDTRLSRLAWRRFLAGMLTAKDYQQRSSRATLILVFAAVFLFSQALWLP